MQFINTLISPKLRFYVGNFVKICVDGLKNIQNCAIVTVCKKIFYKL